MDQAERDRKELERFREALSYIKWVKDCGIDGRNEAGDFVNFAVQERDLMYATACDALRTTKPLLVAPPVTK